MTDTNYSTVAPEPGIADLLSAAEEVVCILVSHMSAKKERKAREAIDRYLAKLEAIGQMPDNVVPIRARRPDAAARSRLAAAVRTIAGPVGVPDYVAEVGQ